MKGDQYWRIKDENEHLQDTDDWEFSPLNSISGGFFLGTGIHRFRVRSIKLEQYGAIAFVGLGIGAGVVGSLVFDPGEKKFHCSSMDWVSVKKHVVEPFSFKNLLDADVRISIGSIATPGRIGMGGSVMYLTAYYDGKMRQGYLIDKARVFGVGSGTGGVGATLLCGKFIYLGKPDVLSREWMMPACDEDSDYMRPNLGR